MFYIISLIIIAAGLATVGVIIIRKFPQIANLDVDNLPEEKEARKKKELVVRRIEMEGNKMRAVWSQRLRPIIKLWAKLQLRFRIYVGRIERLWHHEQRSIKKIQAPVAVATEAEEDRLFELLSEGEQELRQQHYEKAEQLFIAAIKINAKSSEAYRGLGDTYLAQGGLNEARETYLFLLQLEPANDAVMVKLAEIAEAEGDALKAIEWYQQAVVLNDSLSPRFYHLAELLLRVGEPAAAKEAVVSAVELEPKNPKYLDLLLEVVILLNDKELAMQAFNELRLINPGNQKLAVFQERISKM